MESKEENFIDIILCHDMPDTLRGWILQNKERIEAFEMADRIIIKDLEEQIQALTEQRNGFKEELKDLRKVSEDRIKEKDKIIEGYVRELELAHKTAEYWKNLWQCKRINL
jgi:hypothetical protein